MNIQEKEAIKYIKGMIYEERMNYHINIILKLINKQQKVINNQKKEIKNNKQIINLLIKNNNYLFKKIKGGK